MKNLKFTWTLPVLLGILAFFAVVGPKILLTSNLDWLSDGDFATHYLGWLFFRNSTWSFPVGLNPRYGLEISNAILFSDSNPLLAFLFKPFSSILPETFQYFGLWLLLCFILQAYFAWKLLGLLSDDVRIRILGAVLFVFAPPMLWRIQCHPSLAGHFFITAALYFMLNPDIRRRKTVWAVLLVTAAMVHSYLVAMTALIWLAGLTDKIIKRDISIKPASLELIVVFSAVSIACWQTGYFSVGSGAVSGGFGFYRMNLLSIIDPSGWSFLLKDIPEAPGDYEGFNFLGLGAIALFCYSVPSLVRGRYNCIRGLLERPALLFLISVLFVFSLSNKIGLGLFGWEYHLPHALLGPANVFRASGRMFWPVFYLMLFAIMLMAIRGRSPRKAALLIGLACMLQVVDTSAFWISMRNRLMNPPPNRWSSSLTNKFWMEAAARYRKLRLLYPENKSQHWLDLSNYAGRNGLATDAVFLARVSTAEMEQARRQADAALSSGKYDADTLYVLDRRALLSAFMTANRSTDLLTRIDGLNVLAPGWKQCSSCSAVSSGLKPCEVVPEVEVGRKMSAAAGGQAIPYMSSGWSSPEAWGTWTDGKRAEMFFPVKGKVTSILIDTVAMVNGASGRQDVVAFVNNETVFAATFTRRADNVIRINLSETMQERVAALGWLHLRFDLPLAVSPKKLGIGADDRNLALGLISVMIE